MCIQVVEVFAVCRCVYYIHEVDRCALYGQRGHEVSERVVDVGYACPDHSAGAAASAAAAAAAAAADVAAASHHRIGMTGHARHHGDDAGHCGGLRPIAGYAAAYQRQSNADPVPHWLA
jgi:hypothetical protein